MLTKQQLHILRVFKKDIFIDLTFKQIKEQSKQKSNNIVQIALKEFQIQNIVKTKKTGNCFAGNDWIKQESEHRHCPERNLERFQG